MVFSELIITVLLWADIVVWKELIIKSFYFGRGVLVLKELIFNSSTFNGCDGLERAYS